MTSSARPSSCPISAVVSGWVFVETPVKDWWFQLWLTI